MVSVMLIILFSNAETQRHRVFTLCAFASSRFNKLTRVRLKIEADVSAFALSPLYLRYRFALSPFLIMGEKWDLQGIW